MASKRETIEQSLEEIWETRSRLTPADVVEVATEASHPLHEFFEWDNSEAGKRYRLMQAAGLIRSVKIKFTVERTDEVEDLVVRRWVAPRAAGVETPVPEGYIPEDEARQQPEVRAAILRQMKRDLNGLRRRYMHLDEFWNLMDELMMERVVATG